MKVFGKISNKSGNYNPYIFGFSLSMGLLPRATLNYADDTTLISTINQFDKHSTGMNDNINKEQRNIHN